MVADGKLVALSEKGELIIAQATPAAFEPIARAKVLSGKCWTTPMLSNGRIYCRNAVGDVVCLDVSGRWRRFRRTTTLLFSPPGIAVLPGRSPSDTA